jgi:hypothetical protein
MAIWSLDPNVDAEYTDEEFAESDVAMDQWLAKLGLEGGALKVPSTLNRVGGPLKSD